MNDDHFDLSGDVVVVIGATGVLGGALAEGLARAGAAVAVLGRNAERGEACAKCIADQKGRARFFAADARDRQSLSAAHQEIEAALGAPTVLVNAAGGNDPKVTVTAEQPFEKIKAADWRAGFDLNLVGGALLRCQDVGAAMAGWWEGGHVDMTRG